MLFLRHTTFRKLPNNFKSYHVRFKSFSKFELEKSCKVLGLKAIPATQKDLKERFLQQVKECHPDSSQASTPADPARFSAIQQAYRTLSDHLTSESANATSPPEEEKDFKIKHTVPQHRQYLSHDGVGFGTPSQRQRQWDRMRTAKAADNVLEYRTQRLRAVEENSSLVVKDASLAREYKTSSHAIERLVEDLIQQSMARGDFDNLPGAGKPLPSQPPNPYIDSTTHKLNQVLINNGFVPKWAELAREIAQESAALRADLRRTVPDWQAHVNSLEPRAHRLNSLVDKYNMLVPTVHNQKVHFSLRKEAEKAKSQQQASSQSADSSQKNPPPSSPSSKDSSTTTFFDLFK